VCPQEHYLGAYVPTSSDKEAKLREHLSTVLRQHGIEKVERVAREIWQRMEEVKKEQ
jgi:predicted nucleic acid-binding protein